MKNNVIESIGSIVSLDGEDCSLLENYFERKVLKKHTYLLNYTKVCDFIAFVNEGVLVYLKNNDDADEITLDFSLAGEWVCASESYLCNTPSLVAIKAIEDTEVLVIKKRDLEQLYIKLPKLERFGRILMERTVVTFITHSIDFQTLDASQRYAKLLLNNPAILQKVPLYHIANYLGIKPKSLSRIRNSIFKHPN